VLKAAKRRRAKGLKASDRGTSRSSRVSRWGNSLGLRIPQEAVDKLRLRAGAEVRIEIRSDTIVIKAARRHWTERELLAGVTSEMVGGEVDSGRAVGREIW
jgi:antitoxin MazE